MLDVRDSQLLHQTLERYNRLACRITASNVACLSLHPFPQCKSSISLIRLSDFPDSASADDFTYILNALNSLNEVVGYIIQSNASGLHIYIGFKGENCHNIALNLLADGLTHTFKDLQIKILKNPATYLNALLNPCCFSCVSMIATTPSSLTPSTTSSTSSEVSLMRHFLDLMGTHKDFTIFFLATPINLCEIKQYLNELYDMYNIISGFEKSTYSGSEAIAKNGSTSICNTETCGDGKSCAETDSNSICCTDNQSTSLSGSTAVYYMRERYINTTVGHSQGASNAHTSGHTVANTSSSNSSHSNSKTQLSATNKTDTHGVNYIVLNKKIQTTLASMDSYISFLENLLTIPSFRFSAFFLSEYSEVSIRAAYTFDGLNDHEVSPFSSKVHFWMKDHPQYRELFNYLLNFNHPCFYDDGQSDAILATVPITSRQLTYCYSL